MKRFEWAILGVLIGIGTITLVAVCWAIVELMK